MRPDGFADVADPAEAPLDVPHGGRVLLADFMEPYGIDVDTLAHDLGVGPDAIKGVLAGTRPVDAELALRLARYFGTAEDWWTRLQMAIDLARAKQSAGERIAAEVTPRADLDAAQ